MFPAPVCSREGSPNGSPRRLDTWPEGLFTRRLLVTVCASLEPVSDASVHWFDSLLLFLTSLHGFASVIRFIVVVVDVVVVVVAVVVGTWNSKRQIGVVTF